MHLWKSLENQKREKEKLSHSAAWTQTQNDKGQTFHLTTMEETLREQFYIYNSWEITVVLNACEFSICTFKASCNLPPMVADIYFWPIYKCFQLELWGKTRKKKYTKLRTIHFLEAAHGFTLFLGSDFWGQWCRNGRRVHTDQTVVVSSMTWV